MSNLRQAAQQALEALEQFREISDFTPASAIHAITALRAAISEPEQEPFMVVAPECAERGCMAHDDRVDGSGVVLHLREKQEPQTTHWEGCEAVHPECRKPEQEPVAWFHNDFGSLELSRVQRVGWKPLYTAPTPRKPLSGDQIVDIWAGVSMGYDDEINIIELARAIERHHGIGEQHE